MCKNLIIYVWIIFSFGYFNSPLNAETWNDIKGRITKSGQSNNVIKECGPGFVLTKQRGIAAWLNITFASLVYGPTTTTSVGTSGCKGLASIDSENMHKFKFIANNYHFIQEDVVRGEGRYLESLSALMMCDLNIFTNHLKDNYETYFVNTFTSQPENYVFFYNTLEANSSNNCVNKSYPT